jgi:hypothetical protein
MNIGQVLEVHLGWAAKGLGQKIQRMLDAQAKIADLRKFLDEIYNHDPDKGLGTHAERVDLKQFSDAELLRWRRTSPTACRWRPRCSTAPPSRDQEDARAGRPAAVRPDRCARRSHRRGVRS